MKTPRLKTPRLVRNDAGHRIQSLVCNLVPAKVRHDTMEGRNYLVAPMVILTEGVHNGSDGSLYYPGEELAKTPVAWNHKPIVVYHPEMNGVGISACDPDIITSRKVGVMMNTKFDKGRLRSEAWLEKERADIVDPRIMQAVEKKQMMELSTGVFVDVESAEGKWKNESYTAVARNYRPDHLALLPDKIGACSIADGAGFMRNETRKAPDLQRLVAQMRVTMDELVELVPADNALSFSNIREALNAALRKKFSPGNEGPFLFIEDVYSDFVIYDLKQKLFRVGYSATDTEVTLDNEKPVEVVRVTEYRTVQGAFVGNTDQNQKGKDMDKQKIVDAIIANKKSVWKTEDQERLMAFTEDQLKVIHNALEGPESPAVNAPAMTPAMKAQMKKMMDDGMSETEAKAAVLKKAATKNDDDGNTPATNALPKPAVGSNIVTVEQFIGQAPAAMQEVLRNSMSVYEAEKAKLIETIVANENNEFDKEELQTRSLKDLKAIARLAAKPEARNTMPLYSGQGPVPSANQGEEPLALPTMNFEKPKAA